MEPFDRTGNVYVIATKFIKGALIGLNQMKNQAEDGILEEPLLYLILEIETALEKFQANYPPHKELLKP